MIEVEKTCPFCSEPTGGRVCGVCLEAVELMSRVTVTRARLQIAAKPVCQIEGCTALATCHRSFRSEVVELCAKCGNADSVYRDGNSQWRLSYAF